MHIPEHLDAIRRLNDAARSHPGTASIANVTLGFQALPDADRFTALAAIVSYSQFESENDPYGEHDFGAVEVEGEKVFWKIDYYSPDLTEGSEDPANEGVTHRVLTIMLPSEY